MIRASGLVLAAVLAFTGLGGCEQDAEQRVVVREHLVLSGIPIETAEELAGIGIVEGYPADGEYYLTGDIDLSPLWEVGEDDPPYVWRSIGSTCRECKGPLLPASKTTHVLPLRCENRDCALYWEKSQETQTPFSGMLHGNSYTISGLKLPGALPEGTTSGYEQALYFGLFGYISTAYIHDVTVRVANTDEDRAAYSSTVLADVQPSFGVLAGLSRGSRIVNVCIEADTDSAATTGLYVSRPAPSVSATSIFIGGIVGLGYDTSLTGSTSAATLDADCLGNEYIGGIAGALTGEIRDATVTGNITVVSRGGSNTKVAGICSYPSTSSDGLSMRDCTVTMDAFTLNTPAAASGHVATILSGIGYGEITDCVVAIKNITVYSTSTTTARRFYVGGISASSSAGGYSVEGCRVRFDKLEVKTENDALISGTVYIGGIAAFLTTGTAATNTQRVNNCVVEGGGELVVTLPNMGANSLNVGGLAGTGHVSHSSIPGGLKITITTNATGGVNAGGLTGNGVAEYSFIGSAAKHASLTVNHTATATGVYASVGGISGNTTPTLATAALARPFQYNYAFCDVTLITTAATVSGTSGQTVGGLAGYYSGTSCLFTESYAAGSVTLTNNYGSSNTNQRIQIGGIVGFMAGNNANATLSKCAALNSDVTINGSNTDTLADTLKTWRRIAYPVNNSTTPNIINNITTITSTLPNSYTPTNSFTTKNGDGFLVTDPLTEDTFLGTGENQLGWNKAVWKWDADSGYPVLK